MEVEPDAVRWNAELGERLRMARGAMSKREAARRAGFSESTWRALELGKRRPAKGVEVPVNPTVENIRAAARAVGLDGDELLILVGVNPTRWGTVRRLQDQRPVSLEGDEDPTIHALRVDPDLSEEDKRMAIDFVRRLKGIPGE